RLPHAARLDAQSALVSRVSSALSHGVFSSQTRGRAHKLARFAFFGLDHLRVLLDALLQRLKLSDEIGFGAVATLCKEGLPIALEPVGWRSHAAALAPLAAIFTEPLGDALKPLLQKVFDVSGRICGFVACSVCIRVEA